MGRELHVVWVGRHRRDEWERLTGRYRERIAHHIPVRDVPLKVRAGGDDARRLRIEADAIREALPDPCWSVALDRRGRSLSSRELAGHLRRWTRDWPHPVAFLVGSDLGLDAELVSSCRFSLSLGRLTLPHELARLVLYEQIYRGLSILAGIKYHRESF